MNSDLTDNLEHFICSALTWQQHLHRQMRKEKNQTGGIRKILGQDTTQSREQEQYWDRTIIKQGEKNNTGKWGRTRIRQGENDNTDKWSRTRIKHGKQEQDLQI